MRLKKYFFLALSALLIGVTTSSHAILPPLSDTELNRRANVIVQAEVIGTQIVSEVQANSCSRRTDYVATLKPIRRIKGQVSSPKFDVHYSHYQLGDGCTGPVGIFVLQGEKGKFHLRCNADMSDCRVIEPNGFLRSLD